MADEGGGSESGNVGQWFLPSVKQLIFGGAVVVLTHVIVAIVGVWTPYSAYFRLDAAMVRGRLATYRTTSAEALAEIRAWQSEHGHAHPLFSSPAPGQRLCVGVISRRRADEGQLGQTVAGLLSRTPLSYESVVRMTVFNAEVPGPANGAAGAVADVIRVEELYDTTDMRPSALDAARAPPRARAMLDYATVLRRLHAQGCEHGVVLDDDVLPAQGWAERLVGILAEWGDEPAWVTLRLIASFDWLTWDIGRADDLAILLGLGGGLTVVACVLFFGLSKALKWEPAEGAGGESDGPTATLAGVLFASFVMALVLAGRPNVVVLGRGVHRTDTQHGASANLFPRPRMLEYAMLLEEHLEGAQQAGALHDVRRRDDFFGDLRDILEARALGMLATGELRVTMDAAGFGSGVGMASAMTVGAIGTPWGMGLWTWLAGDCHAARTCGLGGACVPALPTRLWYALGSAVGMVWGGVKALFGVGPLAGALFSEAAGRWARRPRWVVGSGPRAFSDDHSARVPAGAADTYALQSYVHGAAQAQRPTDGAQPWGAPAPGLTPLLGSTSTYDLSPLAMGKGPRAGWWGSLFRGTWHASAAHTRYRKGPHAWGTRGGTRFAVAVLVPSLFMRTADILSPVTNGVQPGATLAYDFPDAGAPVAFRAAEFMGLETPGERRAIRGE